VTINLPSGSTGCVGINTITDCSDLRNLRIGRYNLHGTNHGKCFGDSERDRDRGRQYEFRNGHSRLHHQHGCCRYSSLFACWRNLQLRRSRSPSATRRPARRFTTPPTARRRQPAQPSTPGRSPSPLRRRLRPSLPRPATPPALWPRPLTPSTRLPSLLRSFCLLGGTYSCDAVGHHQRLVARRDDLLHHQRHGADNQLSRLLRANLRLRFGDA
jgi:hypothetical protein